MGTFATENSPIISVLIPVYNGRRYLDESIKAILNQKTEVSYEVVIVDDQSTDDSIEIATKYVDDFDNIRLVKNTTNLGLVGNWNECIKQAKGEWFKFHFQDDLIDENCLQKVYEAAVANNVNFVLTDRSYFFEEKTAPTTKEFFEKLLTLSQILKESQLVTSQQFISIFKNYYLKANILGEPICGFFNKDWVIKKLGCFDSNLRQIVDYEFFIRAMATTDSYFLNEQLVAFRVHCESQTSKNSKVSLLGKADRLYINHLFLTKEYYSDLRKQVGVNAMCRFEFNLIKEVGFFAIQNRMTETNYPYVPSFKLIYLYYEFFRRLNNRIKKMKSGS